MCVAYKLFSWRVSTSTKRVSSVRRSQNYSFIKSIALIFLFLLSVSLLRLHSLYGAYSFQASVMLFSAPNIVFVACVAFNQVFWYLLLLVQYVVPPFSDRFFIVCCFFSPCV